MKLLIQRIKEGRILVDGREVASQDSLGLLIYVGVHREDSEDVVDKMVSKVINMRIFEDEAGKFNLSLLDIKGGALVVSQFTLYADTRKGRRPSFFDAAAPNKAQRIYELFIDRLRQKGIEVGQGVFGAKMEVIYNNFGPVSIIVDSNDF